MSAGSLAGALVLALTGAPEPSGPALWFVDLERVLLESPEGKRVRAEIEKRQAAVEAEVRAREDVLIELRKRLEASGDPTLRAQYDERAGAHEQFVAAQTHALEEAQDTQLQPLIDRLTQLIEGASERPAELLVLDRGEHPPLQDAPCDATSWLARAFAGKKAPPPKAEAKCRPRGVAYVDLQKVLGALDEAKAAASRIGALQRERQDELDRAARALADARGPKAEKERLELADRYAAWQKDLAAREAKELSKVEASARARVEDASQRFSGALFLRRMEGVEPLPGSCDVTTPFVEAKGAPSEAQLVAACPALAGKHR